MSAISAMPFSPMSSSRPMNGLTKVAPALAARIAWAAEKHSVTLTIAPSSVRRRQARSPSGVSGTFTVMFLAIAAQHAGLGHHAVEFGGGDLGADRAGDDGADFGQHVLELLARSSPSARGWW